MTDAERQAYASVRFGPLASSPGMGEPVRGNLDLLRDIRLTITVELGRSSLPLREVMKLVEGSVIEMDQLAGDPVHVYVAGKIVADGEVVVIGSNFGVKITRIHQSELAGAMA
ncbi:MAG: flagellar motor switch protein FliN [Candidatus Sericytochromatia bacterium]|nr:flagellar motor switch protein FliN [Candidatus Tanganyikabacteria bacterium]